MTNKKSGESRRKLLKSIAAGSGALIVGKSLPESWSRPIVDSVMLPAHAQASVCFAGPLTIDDTDANFGFNDSVALIFDGNTCSLEEIPSDRCGGTCNADTMLVIDNDSGEFDLNSPYGSNWGPGPDVNDLAPGTHTYTNTRTGGVNNGNTYSVTFTVGFADSAMTVSNVSFMAV